MMMIIKLLINADDYDDVYVFDRMLHCTVVYA